MAREIPKELLTFRIDRRLKRDYQRACRLLNTTMTGPVYRAILSTISKAREHFPEHWGLLSDYEEIIIEAIEESCWELDQIVNYTRLPRDRVIQIIASLCERGIVGEGKRPQSAVARGAVQRVYVLRAGATD